MKLLNQEVPLFTTYPHDGNLNKVFEQQSSPLFYYSPVWNELHVSLSVSRSSYDLYV